MELSDLTIRLLLIFFPGIIAALIIDNLTIHRGRDFKIFILNSLVLGLTSYFLLYIFLSSNNIIVELRGLKPTWDLNFKHWLNDKNIPVNITEVVIVTIVAIVLAFIISAAINNKLLHRFGKKVKVTKKFGQLDVWSYVFDSPDISWIIVRDNDNDLMYQGWLEAFSDTFEKNELFIREVTVYRNSSAEELYTMEAVYITKDCSNLVLEFPVVGEEKDGGERECLKKHI